jgi:hypothetical protein
MNNQYYMVINNYNEAAENYRESELISKFEFLKAMSLGKIMNLDTLAFSLEQLVDSFPESTVTPMARDILSRLQPDESGEMVLTEKPISGEEGRAAQEGEAFEETFSSVYKPNNESVHFFMALVDASKTNINALKIRMSDFNMKYYLPAQLKINSIVFQNDIQIITVGNFENADRAMSYYRALSDNSYITAQLPEFNEMAFPVSVDNYPIFYREKNIEDYYKFFRKTYLKETEEK